MMMLPVGINDSSGDGHDDDVGGDDDDGSEGDACFYSAISNRPHQWQVRMMMILMLTIFGCGYIYQQSVLDYFR